MFQVKQNGATARSVKFMKRNNLLAALLILMVQNSFAYEYQITCADKKLTKFDSLVIDQSTDECKAFISNGFLECFDSRKPNKSLDLMTLATPNDHYYKSKESTRYSRKAIQDIIDAAIKAGNDPYLTLSIVITENPPVVAQNKVAFDSTAMYAENYGRIPLDTIAVADTMGCERVNTGYGQNGLMELKSPFKLKKIVLETVGVEKTVCMNGTFTAGESAQYFISDKPADDECCMKVRASAADFKSLPNRDDDSENDSRFRAIRSKILDALAQKYMSARFNAAHDRAAGEKLPQSKMAMVAQAYNGYGVFGASEGVSNRCLQKIKMGVTPVYGAGTSEIMLNSLMNNSEVQGMVADSLKKNKVAHPVSHLCASYGAGIHKVDGYTFTNLLEGYIGDRKTCPNVTNKIKNLSKFTKASLPKNPFSGTSEPSSPNYELKKSNPTGTAN